VGRDAGNQQPALGVKEAAAGCALVLSVPPAPAGLACRGSALGRWGRFGRQQVYLDFDWLGRSPVALAA
jgi:hypothetical protein